MLDEDEITFHSFGPIFPRPTPPGLALDQEELRWVSVDEPPEFLWDYTMCSAQSREEELRGLVEMACGDVLSGDDCGRFKSLLKENHKIVNELEFTADRVKSIVEHNPEAAAELLASLEPLASSKE